MKRVAGESRILATTHDETGGLAAGFNTVTAKLKENNGLRRRFLADNRGGTELGLGIVREIAEADGGNVATAREPGCCRP